jgi:hypothetical protein
MARGRAEIEMMFNTGQQRIYYAPASIIKEKNKTLKRDGRNFLNLDDGAILSMASQAYDFLSDKVKIVTKTVKEETGVDLAKAGDLLKPTEVNKDAVNNYAYKAEGYKSDQSTWYPYIPDPKPPKPVPMSNININ